MIFFATVTINTVANIVIFYFESQSNGQDFWNNIDITTATVMSSLFTIPMILACVMVLKNYNKMQKYKNKKQFNYLLHGIIFTTFLSVFSKYIGPVFMPQLKTYYYMYFAITVLFVFLYLAIVKEKFLNVELEYIYQQLFLNFNEGIILIDENKTIANINYAAKAILGCSANVKAENINQIIKDYDYFLDNHRYEIVLDSTDEIKHISLSQNHIKIDNKKTMKLLHIIDTTPIKLKQQLEKRILSEKLIKDGLTNLYNKRFFNENYLSNIKTSEKDNTILFIDIDNFKEINDTYGHLIGDESIKVVAEIIKINLRKEEIALRYGGDEFIIIIENTSIDDAYKIAERIRKSVMEIRIINENINLTLSIGISKGDEDINTLIERADKAMYNSKTNGKNQTIIYG